jgi:hypothetical protein
MNSEPAQVFLNRIKDKIEKGEFDKELTVPFMKKDSIYASIKARVLKKLETGGTPLLTDTEIKDAIHDAKEVAAISLEIFSKIGILKKIDGEWVVTPAGEKLLKYVKSY